MKVYKFGGASINSVERIINLVNILRNEGTEDLVLILSAMGKTTNKIEEILSLLNQQKDYTLLFDKLKIEFIEVINALFNSKEYITKEVNKLFNEFEEKLYIHKAQPYNFLYDQIVPFGELITVKIISTYLAQEGLSNTLLNAYEYIETDTNYRDATIDWSATHNNINTLSNKHDFFITQGFIAGNKNGYTTTLGREGSDYSAAIFAYCLNATELVIWKDVEGVLNADPRHFKDTILLKEIPFNEAIELAYYGASIIHPKTIQPLNSKEIPLQVRSFLNPEGIGTRISKSNSLSPNVPCYILKEKQHLLQIASRDFSFIVENDISEIFKILCETQMKVNLLHNSAISLSLCIDDRLGDIDTCIDRLQKKYSITHKKDVTLYTVRNFCEKDFIKRFGNITPIVRQSKDNVVHIIIENTNEN